MRHVLVQHPEASGRRGAADRTLVARPVNAVDGVAEVERLRSKRIDEAAGYRDGQARLALAHLRRRRPGWPGRDTADLLGSCPGKAVPSDRDRVSVGLVAGKHVVELSATGIDDDRTRLLILFQVDH